jgi:hypothetical protein
MSNPNCPNPLSQCDAAALIGVLANLEGLVWVNGIDDHAALTLLDRLESDGIAAPAATAVDVRYNLRQALNDLNQRLRYTLGEYDSPPNSAAVPR